MEAIFWLAAMIFFLFIEANTVSLVSLWFAAGALVAMIVSLFHGQLWLQATLFLVTSGLLLGCLRPLARKHFKPKLTKTNVDSIVGSEGYVTAAIDNVAAAGQVKLGAMYWTARSASGEPIAEGTLVKVTKIEGVKAFVTPVREPIQQEEVNI